MNNQSESAKSAEQYIQYATKQDVKHKEITLDEHGRINVDRHKSIKVDHVALATQFIKMANVVPGISALSRRIITTRLINPGISTTGIGISLGMRDAEVLKHERDGLNRIKQFLSRISTEDAVAKANRDNLVNEAVKNLNLQGKDNSLLK